MMDDGLRHEMKDCELSDKEINRMVRLSYSLEEEKEHLKAQLYKKDKKTYKPNHQKDRKRYTK